MKKKALISVSDKNNLLPFCQELVKLNFEIISTGGTKNFLDENGIATISISDITNFPEMLDGRVKTLHPNIHAGILADKSKPSHIAQMIQHQLDYIDLIVVNLYPFKQTILKENVPFEEAIENIDVGGPTMLRSAAKNYKNVTVICHTEDYNLILDELKIKGNTDLETRKKMALKVFEYTANYDSMIVDYLKNHHQDYSLFPETFSFSFEKVRDLRYGENPHQKAVLYKKYNAQADSLCNAKILQGKAMSYNNIQDSDVALNILKEFKINQSVCVAIKHCNPCGVAIGNDNLQAWQKSSESDPVSIFGGIVAFNKKIEQDLAMILKDVFLEIIIAPSFSKEVLDILSSKKNLRLIEINTNLKSKNNLQIKSIVGGVLVQQKDELTFDVKNINCVSNKLPSEAEIKNLDFAWKVVKHIKSNAVVLTSNETTIGIGAGQTSRIGAAKIAFEQMKNKGIMFDHIALASDAFFPFDDVVRLAHQYGVTTIIQPGGSVRDKDSIEACNELGISMLFTNIRHFNH